MFNTVRLSIVVLLAIASITKAQDKEVKKFPTASETSAKNATERLQDLLNYYQLVRRDQKFETTASELADAFKKILDAEGKKRPTTLDEANALGTQIKKAREEIVAKLAPRGSLLAEFGFS